MAIPMMVAMAAGGWIYYADQINKIKAEEAEEDQETHMLMHAGTAIDG